MKRWIYLLAVLFVFSGTVFAEVKPCPPPGLDSYNKGRALADGEYLITLNTNVTVFSEGSHSMSSACALPAGEEVVAKEENGRTRIVWRKGCGNPLWASKDKQPLYFPVPPERGVVKAPVRPAASAPAYEEELVCYASAQPPQVQPGQPATVAWYVPGPSGTTVRILGGEESGAYPADYRITVNYYSDTTIQLLPISPTGKVGKICTATVMVRQPRGYQYQPYYAYQPVAQHQPQQPAQQSLTKADLNIALAQRDELQRRCTPKGWGRTLGGLVGGIGSVAAGVDPLVGGAIAFGGAVLGGIFDNASVPAECNASFLRPSDIDTGVAYGGATVAVLGLNQRVEVEREVVQQPGQPPVPPPVNPPIPPIIVQPPVPPPPFGPPVPVFAVQAF